MLKLPLGAERNLPDRWKLWDHERSIGFIFPSVSGNDGHIVMMNKGSRDMNCDCKGFWFNGGVCRHVKLVIASLHKAAKKRKKGPQDTSIEAFQLLTVEALERSQRIVLNALGAYGPMCNREISEVVGKPINTITPRVNEGYKMGFIRDAGRKIDPVTNRTVIVWALEE